MTYIKKKRKISIIMGIYNCEATIEDALKSLMCQTYKDWELIMCNDCSTDNTVKIAQTYSDMFDNILLIHNSKNEGLAFSLNHCLEYVDSEYVARMDADDLSLPTRLEKEVNFLENNKEYALVSCAMICFDSEGDWGVQVNPEKPTKKDFIYGSPFCHAPVMMRRIILNNIGNYTVKKFLRRGQDYYLWHKFYYLGYKGYNIQEPLYKMRDDENAASRRSVKSGFYSSWATFLIFKDLNIPIRYYYRILRPILVSFLPRKFYSYLHKKKVNK